MSRRHTDYYWAHIAELQQATYSNHKGRTVSFQGHGLLLIGWLCDRARNDDGTVFMTQRTMSEETRIPLSTVKRLLAAFQQVGWLTDTGEVERYMGKGTPTPIYLVSLVPPVPVNKSKKNSDQVSHQVSQQVSQVIPENTTKPLEQRKTEVLGVSYPYPYPEPKPEPEPKSERTDQAGAGKGEKVGELIALCVQRDLETRPPTGEAGAGLKRKLGNEYRPLVRRALEQYPNAPDTALVDYCIGKRRKEPVSASLVATLRPDMANCEKCKGYGKVFIDMGEGGTLPLDCPTCNAPALSLTGT